MHDKETNLGYENYSDGNLWEDSSDESTYEISETEYYSPRFGEINDSEVIEEYEIEELNEQTNEQNYQVPIESELYASKEHENEFIEKASNIDERDHLEYNEVQEQNFSTENSRNMSIQNQKSNLKLNESDFVELKELEFSNNSNSSQIIKNSDKNLTKNDIFVVENVSELNKISGKINLENSSKNNIFSEDLQAQVKSLLEASNKHQEEVHAHLDNLLIENEKLKIEIKHLNLKLNENELIISRYKLSSMALTAQLPFLKSKAMLEEDKEELKQLRSKAHILEEKLNNLENEIENYKIYKDRCSFLENELERITNEFSELERFQMEQLRIADSEIIALTEAKNTLFKDVHSVMRENESLKLTKTALKRMESYYKNIKDETVLPNIETELNEAINMFKENNENFIDSEQSSIVFKICQSIIPRLAYEIAEEIVYTCENDHKNTNMNKKSLTRKNVSIQAGFPLLHGSSLETSEIDTISSRGELLALREENNKLKKENQKLKQDIFLMKRIRNRSKETNKIAAKKCINAKQIDHINEIHQEESVLNGIKWLTSVVNEIDELEQRCNNIKSGPIKSDTRRSTAYNSTVASFEDIKNMELRDRPKIEVPINNELNILREKLISEGILNEE